MKTRLITPTLFAILLAAAALAVTACAPAAGTDAVGLDIGKTTPPFAMTLSDGSQVTSDNLADAGQPVHLFWFATW